MAPIERAVLILTGHTLKDSDYTIRYHRHELLNDDEERGISTADQAANAGLRKPPVVLDARIDSVLKVLDEQMALAGQLV